MTGTPYDGAAVSLAGRVALVTGAGSGIGRAIAVDLASRGMRVLLAGRTRRTLEATAARLPGAADAHEVLPVDLADSAAIDALTCGLRSSPAAPDVLVHAAGVHLSRQLDACAPEELAEQFAANAIGPARLTRQLLPVLRQKRGQIVFVHSSAVVRPAPLVEVYASAKFALVAFARNLRDEVNGDGVRVLSVFPGRTASPMQEQLHALEGKSYAPDELMQPADVAWMIGAALTAPRSAEVTDIHMRPMRKPTAESVSGAAGRS